MAAVDGWDEPAPGKKRVVILTSGSRGDTQPYIAVGLALKAAGHAVRLGVEERLKPLVEEFGLNYFRISGDPTAILWSQESQQMLREGRVMALMSKMESFIAPFYQQCLVDYENACIGADVIVTGPLCFSQAYCIAEKMKKPFVPILLGPTLKTGDFPLFFLMHTNLGIGWINRATYNLMFFGLWQNEKKRINPWRENHLGLQPITYAKGVAGYFEDYPNDIPIILGFNRAVIPTFRLPKDYPASATLTGFLFVPRTPEEQVDPVLREFVERTTASPAGKPIYLGFGSMPTPNPGELLNLAIQVVNKLNCSAVLCAGWSALSDLINTSEPGDSPSSTQKIRLPPNLLVVKSAPHDWLFPRCSVIVHHCGVGTTGASLRSGVPQVPCPVMLDQPFFGAQMHHLGVAPEPIPFPDLTLEKLVAALRIASTSQAMKDKAALVARDMAEDDATRGVKLAVTVIEEAKIPSYWK